MDPPEILVSSVCTPVNQHNSELASLIQNNCIKITFKSDLKFALIEIGVLVVNLHVCICGPVGITMMIHKIVVVM